MPPKVELYVENFFLESSSVVAASTEFAQFSVSEDIWESWFDKWLDILSVDLPTAPSYEIGLRLTNDAQIQELNSQYRQQNKPTDVLAFAALEADFPQTEEMLASQPLYLGDIIVSIDTAQQQAQQQEHSLTTELAWLTAHGLLHLLGWDHPDEESLMQMLKQQVILLDAVGILIDLK
ncbi:rRNA maturation RNase YbeY [Sphaerospermopsis aphanizomenoides BCCUSP55]|uniref:rRNA maturation RNase YbeY n=1 Tax=Sphaerospermopsis aphanizomenoides TaxID=459663 RepID=UPI000A9F4ADB|nr:rRNA maturation RNase YbeY [Sphaerospermopsis aphanizomenoides]MBK1989912.1 rRNA maturation RNase YbeY [Sphaerospermopsis aphanizomenoides BCCUSP55]